MAYLPVLTEHHVRQSQFIPPQLQLGLHRVETGHELPHPTARACDLLPLAVAAPHSIRRLPSSSAGVWRQLSSTAWAVSPVMRLAACWIFIFFAIWCKDRPYDLWRHVI